MRRAADEYLVADDLPRDPYRQVVLPEMQDRCPHRPRHVGSVVDGEQLAVPFGGRRERLQQHDLRAGLESLLPQLHNVDARSKHSVEELREIAGPSPRIGAQVEAGTGNDGVEVEHRPSVVWASHGSPVRIGLRGRQPTVEPDPGNTGAREQWRAQPAPPAT